MLIYFSILLIIGQVLGTELCKEKEWYDDLVGKCRKCRSCVDKLWEAAPCTAFMDTMCVDLAEISRSLAKGIQAGEVAIQQNFKVDIGQSNSKQLRWHEMEGKNEIPPPVENTKDTIVSKNLLDGSYDQWDIIFILILGVLFMFFIMLIIMGTIRYYGNPLHWDRTKVTRSRLFSRDRLNTTEYMNNLATLDRRLAIDEILEKKKKAAIFEPQLLKENIYTDEVFVDISGLPRNLRKNPAHDYEEIDHKKCLLEMQDQQ